LETALFRVVQEGLANAARHAHARRAELALEWDEKAVRLCLSDDGQGFDLQEAQDLARQGGHLGLWSMRERVEQLGGQFAVESAPGRGTRLKMTILRGSRDERNSSADRR
jgi:signal transduction histidine kinase